MRYAFLTILASAAFLFAAPAQAAPEPARPNVVVCPCAVCDGCVKCGCAFQVADKPKSEPVAAPKVSKSVEMVRVRRGLFRWEWVPATVTRTTEMVPVQWIDVQTAPIVQRGRVVIRAISFSGGCAGGNCSRP